MSAGPGDREAILARLPAAMAGRLRDSPELLDLVARHLEETAPLRARLGIGDPAFVARLLQSVGAAGDPSALASIHAVDLALAEGCANGHPEAMAELERRFVPEVLPALRRVEPSTAFVDEALQAWRERLLIAEGERPPKIATYQGSGPLAGWVTAVAVRVALNLRRGRTSHEPLDDRVLAGLTLQEPSNDFAILVQQSRAAFQESFKAALRQLAPQDVNVLRLHYAGGLTLDRVAEMYGVHRATVARWIARSRDHLFEATKEGLKARLQVDSAEFSQLLELVRSQLDLTLSRALQG